MSKAGLLGLAGIAAVVLGFLFFMGDGSGLSVSVDPDEGPSGTTPTITVSGSANTAVTLDIGGAIITDYTDAGGTLVIDKTSIYGRPGDVVTITATMGSGSDEQTATTTFTITGGSTTDDPALDVGDDTEASSVAVSVDPGEGPSGTTPTITVSGPANTAVTLDIGGAIITDYTDAGGTLVIDRTSIYGQPGDVVTITATMGSGPDEQTATTTFTITADVVTTTSSTSTTAAATTTTAAAAPAATPSGSGCSPPGDTLPDGDWFGFIEGIDPEGEAHLTFDLACYFEGDQADLAAAADGHPTPLEFKPYVRNRNPKVFDVVVSGEALVEALFVYPDTIGFYEWLESIGPEDGCSAAGDYYACPAWLKIQDGAAVLIYGFLPEWSGDGRGS